MSPDGPVSEVLGLDHTVSKIYLHYTVNYDPSIFAVPPTLVPRDRDVALMLLVFLALFSGASVLFGTAASTHSLLSRSASLVVGLRSPFLLLLLVLREHISLPH